MIAFRRRCLFKVAAFDKLDTGHLPPDCFGESLRDSVAVIELGLPARDAEIDLRPDCDVLVPTNLPCETLELEECRRLELRDAHKNAARGTKPKVCPRHGGQIARPTHAALFRLGADPKRPQLVGANGLDPRCSDREGGQSVGLFGRTHSNNINVMQKQIALIVLFGASLAACAGRTSTETGDPRTNELPGANGAKIEVLAEGGIAALSINQIVRHDDRYFQYTQRHLCTNACAALDSASGALSASANDALFNAILAASPFTLKNDYGSTHGAADMMEYTVRITVGGNTKTITGDDGTMPQQVRQIVAAVQETISAARK